MIAVGCCLAASLLSGGEYDYSCAADGCNDIRTSKGKCHLVIVLPCIHNYIESWGENQFCMCGVFGIAAPISAMYIMYAVAE